MVGLHPNCQASDLKVDLLFSGIVRTCARLMSLGFLSQFSFFDWNMCDFWEQESTGEVVHKPHKLIGRAPRAYGHLVSRLGVSFGHKEANIRIKISSKFQPNQSYRSPDL